MGKHWYKRSLWLAAALAFGASLANASLTYTCDPSIDATQAGTCTYLNTTIAGLYNSTFSNANGNIYIEMGITGLGESTSGDLNLISYSTYLADLTATASGDAVDTAALASLPSSEPAIYSGGSIDVTSALGEAIGIPDTSLVGITSSGSACFTPGVGSCYNGIITITTPANLLSETGQSLYWRQTGGSQPGNSYDFYSVVEHETDEILGTASCISTTGPSLSDACGGSNASAVDLFRYSGSGTLVFSSTTPGAYFSYNGGVANGANGAVFNTLSDGDDYADFTRNCQDVQDETGCVGGSLDITTDGGAEVNILDSVGYNLNQGVPEPGTITLVGAGFGALAMYRRRSRA
jgi:PEP-CTERM motif-containing protein